MPEIRFRQSLAAGAVVDNAFAGSQWEFLPYNASLNFGINADANGHEVLCDVYSGTDVLLENGPLNSAAAFPKWPDDYTLSDVAAAGERLKVRLRNTGAVAHIVFISLRIDPL